MICPACKGDMIVVEYHNIELDYCTGCKGVWFDAGELELLLDSPGLEEAKLFLDNILNSPGAIASEKKRRCPICGNKMNKTTIAQQPKILIDMCRGEHGLWFDGGELTQVIRHLAEKHLPEEASREQVINFLGEVFQAPK